MAFQEKLEVAIETIFNSAGFDKLQAELKQTKAQMASTFGQVKQLRSLRRETEKFADVMDRAGLERGEGRIPFTDAQGNIVGVIEGTQRMADAMDRADIASAGFSDNVGASNKALQGLRGSADDIAEATAIAGAGFSQNVRDDPMGLGGLRDTPQTRSMFSGTGLSRFVPNMSRLSEVSAIANLEMSNMKGKLGGLAGGLKDAAGGARGLQMRLLGLQFTMLTVAFIFGGLMAGALGAVGVFEVLGNTLKFLFLPTALNVLDSMLGFQDAIMGLDRETRQMIGDAFLWISVLTVAISILAVLGKAVITVWGGLSTLGGWINTVVDALTRFSSLGKAVVGVLKFFTGAASSTAALIGGIASAVLGAIAAFTVIDAIFKRFGKTIGAIVGILVAIAAAIAAFLVGPFVLAAALIGVAIGAIAAVIWNLRDEIISALVGLVQFIIKWGMKFVDLFVGFFEWLHKTIVGNSIIPDLVNGIINWLMKLPKAALNIGKNFVDSLVKGIKGIGNGIWNAFKKVLPDFVVDALEGAGQVAANVGSSVANFGQGLVQGAQNFAGGVGNTVGNFFGGGGNQGGASVQNNNINAQVQVNDKEETPQETGRKFGQGMAQGLNQRNSNISSGT